MEGNDHQIKRVTMPEGLPKRITGGSITALFDKTPEPKKNSDTFCPHFWELKYANGCDYDCQWCLDGETKIMMNDLSWKDMKDIVVGDRVMGTKALGSTNKLTPTPVIAIQKTIKPRLKLTMDKTTIISSYDHKFLSYLSRWSTARNLATAEGGIKFVTNPTKRTPETSDYMSGYLQGISDGDGTVGTYESNNQKQYKYRLAMKDKEAIDRAERYFKAFEIEMNRFMHKAGSGTMLHAIRKEGKNNYNLIDETIHRPLTNLKEHYAGYLAGIFDAEGSYSCHNLRIANTDEKILTRIKEAIKGLGFAYKEENHKNHIPVIRITGGVEDHLKLFNTINPAITRKISDLSMRFSNTSPIWKAERMPQGELYDIQTGTENFIANGLVSHNCYLNGTFRQHERGKRPYLKDLNKIKRELQEALLRINGPVLFNAGEVSDALVYPSALLNTIIPLFKDTGSTQHHGIDATGELKRTKKKEWKGTNPEGHKLLLLTKSDSNIVAARANAVKQVIFAYSINAAYVSNTWEIGAPHPIERLAASRKAVELGYPTRLRIDPMVPVESWKAGYQELVKKIMEINPWAEVITLGSLRGLTSTLTFCDKAGNDMSWKNYLEDKTNWGIRVPKETRIEQYAYVIRELRRRGYQGHIALCKESLEVWKELHEMKIEIDGEEVPLLNEPGTVKCNCVL
jgi:DNA repair photolyase